MVQVLLLPDVGLNRLPSNGRSFVVLIILKWKNRSEGARALVENPPTISKAPPERTLEPDDPSALMPWLGTAAIGAEFCF